MVVPRQRQKELSFQGRVAEAQVPQSFVGVRILAAKLAFEGFDGGGQPLGIGFRPAVDEKLSHQLVFDQPLDDFALRCGTRVIGNVMDHPVEGNLILGDRRAVDLHQHGRLVASLLAAGGRCQEQGRNAKENE